MAITLDASADDFESRFGAFLSTKREVSEDVDAAVGARRWSQVLELTSRAACWSDGAARRVARIHAFVGLKRYEDCARAADSGNVPPEVADMVEYCRSKMESP